MFLMSCFSLSTNLLSSCSVRWCVTISGWLSLELTSLELQSWQELLAFELSVFILISWHVARPGFGDRGRVLGTEEGFCTGWHRGQVPAAGDLRQRDLLHCCPDICYRYAAVFVFFHSTAIRSIWPGWISGAGLHGRNSIEGLEYNQEAADHSL